MATPGPPDVPRVVVMLRYERALKALCFASLGDYEQAVLNVKATGETLPLEWRLKVELEVAKWRWSEKAAEASAEALNNMTVEPYSEDPVHGDPVDGDPVDGELYLPGTPPMPEAYNPTLPSYVPSYAPDDNYYTARSDDDDDGGGAAKTSPSRSDGGAETSTSKCAASPRGRSPSPKRRKKE